MHRAHHRARRLLAGLLAAGGAFLVMAAAAAGLAAGGGPSGDGAEVEAPRAAVPGDPVTLTPPERASAPATAASPGAAKPAPERRIYRPLPPPSDFAPPVLSIDEAVHDWGKAFKGEVIEHGFVIENKGRSSLVIREVRPTCGCTKTKELEIKSALGPGEKTTITLSVDTSTLAKGQQKKYADIISNGSSGNEKLWMQGEVEEALIPDPASPLLNVVKKSLVPAEPLTVRFEASPGRTVKIAGLKAAKGLVKTALREIEPGKKYEVTLDPALDPKENAAYQSESIEMEAVVDGKPLTLRTPVHINLKDRIEVLQGKSVYFTKKDTAGLGKEGDASGSLPAKSLDIVSAGGPPHRFRIERAASKAGVFATKVETVEEGKRYRLAVTLLKAPEKQRFVRDVIEILTDDPEVPVITFPAMAQF